MSNTPVKTEAEIYTLCQQVLSGSVNISALINVLINDLRSTLSEDRALVPAMKRRVAVHLGVEDFDELLIPLLASIADDNLRYQYANHFAAIALHTGEHALALRYFALALSPERRTEHTESVAIVAAEQESYDDNALHIDLAVRVVVSAAPEIARLHQRGKLRILDLCCGTGLSALPLIGFGDHIEGVDLDVSGVRRAGREVLYAQLHEGDAIGVLQNLSGPFDLIQCIGAIYHFPQADWLFEQAERLLAPGGLLLFNNWPCPDSADTLVTCSGNLRHCHSERYLNQLAQRHQLIPAGKTWHTIYGNLPNWFMKYSKAS